MKHSTGKPTKAEQERIDRMMALGCIPCASLGLFSLPRSKLECHHILSGGKRISHWYTLCLCKGHHQGKWSDAQRERFAEAQRVAISDGRKAFRAVYGTELDLWLKTQHLLHLDDELPTTKVLPRRLRYVESAMGVDTAPAGEASLARTPTHYTGSGAGDRKEAK